MTIQEKIRNRRLQLGYTMEEVANKVGVAKSTVKKWESGQIESMRQSKVLALANALQVDPSFFFYDFDNNKDSDNTKNEIQQNSIDKVLLSIFESLNDKDRIKVIKFATKLLNSNDKESKW